MGGACFVKEGRKEINKEWGAWCEACGLFLLFWLAFCHVDSPLVIFVSTHRSAFFATLPSSILYALLYRPTQHTRITHTQTTNPTHPNPNRNADPKPPRYRSGRWAAVAAAVGGYARTPPLFRKGQENRGNRLAGVGRAGLRRVPLGGEHGVQEARGHEGVHAC